STLLPPPSGTAMRSTVDLLSQYAAYHRDRRNIATHCVGVPLIVFAVGVLLARPSLGVGGALARGAPPARLRVPAAHARLAALGRGQPLVPDARQRAARPGRQRGHL